MKPRFENPWESLLIVSESGGKQFCLMVDELIGKQEVVIKSLGEGDAQHRRRGGRRDSGRRPGGLDSGSGGSVWSQGRPVE